MQLLDKRKEKSKMLERKITKSIEHRYNSNTQTGLLIDGARQIGKTTIIREFLNSNKINFIEINLPEDSLAREAFDSSASAEQLLLRLSSISNKKLIKNKTVVFIDEIQEANDAITPIKFLVQNADYRFIFSGIVTWH